MKVVLNGIFVIFMGFVTLQVVARGLSYVFPNLNDPATFSPGILFPAGLSALIVMVATALYLNKRA